MAIIHSKYISIGVLLVVVFQIYHVVRMDRHIARSKTSQSRRLGRSVTGIGETPHQTEDAGDHFSACLMIMDDNAHLIEWLAYHYHSLPLRRVIVAVDPRSKTSPSEILQRWEGRMNTTEWSDVDFMPPSQMDAHNKIHPANHRGLTNLFRKRQEEFYARCMARLKYEGHSWVALVDTDEYILPNRNAHRYSHLLRPTRDSQSSETVLSLLQRAKDLPPPSRKSEPTEEETQFQPDDSLEQLQHSPCLPMARLTFGVEESSTQTLGEAEIPWGFDPMDFQTLRWRWHAGRGKKNVNKISKAIIDVSRVDSSLFVPTEQVKVHLPVKEYCKEKDLQILNANSLLVVHHYAGTWEQWSHREDTRGSRTHEAYEKLRAYKQQTDDSIRSWLSEFVQEVGWWTSRKLLYNVGRI